MAHTCISGSWVGPWYFTLDFFVISTLFCVYFTVFVMQSWVYLVLPFCVNCLLAVCVTHGSIFGLSDFLCCLFTCCLSDMSFIFGLSDLLPLLVLCLIQGCCSLSL